MLTPKQAAKQVGVSAALVYQWCKDGLLEHFRFGAKGKRGKVMIDLASLERFIESCRQAPKPVGLRHISLTSKSIN